MFILEVSEKLLPEKQSCLSCCTSLQLSLLGRKTLSPTYLAVFKLSFRYYLHTFVSCLHLQSSFWQTNTWFNVLEQVLNEDDEENDEEEEEEESDEDDEFLQARMRQLGMQP